MERILLRNYLNPHLIWQLLKLGLPVVLIQGGMMAMVLVDTLFVGQLGPLATAAVGLGSTLATSIHLFCTGTLTAIEYFSSRAIGEGDEKKSWFWFTQSLYLAMALGIFAFGLILIIIKLLPLFGISRPLVEETQDFLIPIGMSCLPMFLFYATRQYLASRNQVHFSTLLILIANVANFLFNDLFVAGKLGGNSYGVYGSGLATLLTRVLMCITLFGYTLYRIKIAEIVSPSLHALKQLARLGIPTGSQMLARSLAFSVAGLFVAKLGPVAMAAHTITLNLGGFFFMIPIGMATASCILVAQALGRNERLSAYRIGNLGVAVTSLMMMAIATILYFHRTELLKYFSADPGVVTTGASLLVLVAALQIFDGYQTTVIGAFRGFGNSKIAFASMFWGLWIVGLPLGLLLDFSMELGVFGLWSGLVVGLFTSSVILLWKWRKLIKLELMELSAL